MNRKQRLAAVVAARLSGRPLAINDSIGVFPDKGGLRTGYTSEAVVGIEGYVGRYVVVQYAMSYDGDGRRIHSIAAPRGLGLQAGARLVRFRAFRRRRDAIAYAHRLYLLSVDRSERLIRNRKKDQK